MIERVDWGKRAEKGFLGSGIDPKDRRGHKNDYIDLLQKMALDEALELNGDEIVLDFGCGSGRITYWIGPKVKKVVGLEITPAMIDLAEKNRTVENVEFMLYDGIRFPMMLYPFDLVVSIGVLQTMTGEILEETVSRLARYSRSGGRFFFIEQVSDNPKVGRPKLKEYLQAFEESKLECLQHYPIRNGHWWLLYLIRFGLIRKSWFPRIAHYELEKRREEKGFIRYYKDFLFLLRKGR